ncbi:hypothetical protein BDW68DRAFT_168831 [Aspergillus falconensis]
MYATGVSSLFASFVLWLLRLSVLVFWTAGLSVAIARLSRLNRGRDCQLGGQIVAAAWRSHALSPFWVLNDM